MYTRLRTLIPLILKLAIMRVYFAVMRYSYLFCYRGKRYVCPFCLHSFRKFLPFGLKHQVFQEKRTIGASYRSNAVCPYCHSIDRERLVYLFIVENQLLSKNIRLLHIAPEINLQKFMKKQKIKYFSADLNNPFVDIRMDITNINCPSEYFDAIICNHVLEHIVDDKRAMQELYRVLRLGGWGILQVPHSPILQKTSENFSIVTKEEREKYFGQSDHVRIYGNDYVNRLKSVGFTVEIRSNCMNDIRFFLYTYIFKKVTVSPEHLNPF